MTHARRPHRRRPRGFTLLEVVVALLVFSFGVLGVVGMQARLLQGSTQNGDRARAALLADQAVAQMWAQQSLAQGAWVGAWQALVGSQLPSGAGTISVDATSNVATVQVTWLPTSALPTSATGTATPSRFVTQLAMPVVTP